MLTGNLVRARVLKGAVRPYYLDVDDEAWSAVAEQLTAVFEASAGKTLDEIEDAVEEIVSGQPKPLIARGLAKLLADRCEFETAADADPALVRRTVFEEAARVGWALSAAGTEAPKPLTADERRMRSLSAAAERLKMPAEAVEAAMYGDLKGAQRLVRFRTLTAERLLHRYNVALAQAVLLRAVRMTVRVAGQTPARYRQLFRQLKFHRLMFEAVATPDGGYTLSIDGPASLFRQTTKYGVQMAMFLPALMLCSEWSLDAEVMWGKPEPRPCRFLLDSEDGLRSHHPDTGQYVPDEVAAFAAAFAEKVADWALSEDTPLLPLPEGGVMVPDFRFIHRGTGTEVLMEVLGFWNRGSLQRRLELIRKAGRTDLILALSSELQADEGDLADLPETVTVYRFRAMPLVKDVAGLLKGFLGRNPAPPGGRRRGR
jgi:predicted nuclease of restriction endonuclease-like RecB superfamily